MSGVAGRSSRAVNGQEIADIGPDQAAVAAKQAPIGRFGR